jgi:alpha-amylase
MTTKQNSVGMYRGIYDSPYDAFTNYMNIEGDFINRVNNLYPIDMDNDELNSLLTTIKNQEDELLLKDKEIEKLQTRLKDLTPEEVAPAKAPKAENAPAKKAAPKKEVVKKAPKPVAKKASPKKSEEKVAVKVSAKKSK